MILHATVKLTFLTREEGGRKVLSSGEALRSLQYRPHIVIGDPALRSPSEETLAQAQLIHEGDGEYLGVVFTGVNREPIAGHEVTAEIAFFWHPKISYSEAVPGATFTLREGARIIGYGEILDVTVKKIVRTTSSSLDHEKSNTL